MKLNKLYIAILLFAGILTSCKVGKSYVRQLWRSGLGGNLHGFHTPQSYRPCVGS